VAEQKLVAHSIPGLDRHKASGQSGLFQAVHNGIEASRRLGMIRARFVLFAEWIGDKSGHKGGARLNEEF
jgi:hypothetical protein